MFGRDLTSTPDELSVDRTLASVGMFGTTAAMTLDRSSSALFEASALVPLWEAAARRRRRSNSAM